LPGALQNQLLFQWFKNDVEISDWIGKSTVDLKEAGKYTFKMTALCENLTLESLPIIIKNNISPEITFNYDNEINICAGNIYNLQTKFVPGYKYKWVKNGIEIPNATSNTYNVTSRGVYQVKVSNCETFFEFSKEVKINQVLVAAPILNTIKYNYCNDEIAEISLINQNNYNINWFRNGVELTEFRNQNLITTHISGAYSASFTNIENCSYTSLNTNINFIADPIITISRSTNKLLCYGEEVILTANSNQNGSDFLWSTGEKSKSIKVNKNGVFSVRFKNPYGCIANSENTEVIVNPSINLSIPQEKKICVIAKDKVVLEAASGFLYYIWNGQKTSSSLFEVNKAGKYSLIVEDAYGCTQKIEYNVVQYCKDILIPSAFSPNGDYINDIWQVSGLENDPLAKITVFNRYGNIIYITTGKAPFWDGKFKDTILPVGIYYYSIQSKNSSNMLTGTITLIK